MVLLSLVMVEIIVDGCCSWLLQLVAAFGCFGWLLLLWWLWSLDATITRFYHHLLLLLIPSLLMLPLSLPALLLVLSL